MTFTVNWSFVIRFSLHVASRNHWRMFDTLADFSVLWVYNYWHLWLTVAPSVLNYSLGAGSVLSICSGGSIARVLIVPVGSSRACWLAWREATAKRLDSDLTGDSLQHEIGNGAHPRFSSLTFAENTNVECTDAVGAISALSLGLLVFETQCAATMGETKTHLLQHYKIFGLGVYYFLFSYPTILYYASCPWYVTSVVFSSMRLRDTPGCVP